MANNVIETSIIRDDDRYVTVKVTGVSNSVSWNAAGIALQANSLFGANTSQSFCPLTLTDLKFSMDAGGAAYIQFAWVTANSSQSNSTLFTFGQIGSATFDGMAVFNTANSPTGDIAYTVSQMGNGNSFNFIMTFNKDQMAFLDPYRNYPGNPAGWANTLNAYNVPWTGSP